MAKLSALMDVMANTLGIERARVNVLAMRLRKEGLIRSTGRGLNAADMGPSDAANLVLALLGGGFVDRAASRVRELRRAEPRKWLRNGAEHIGTPDLPFAQRLLAHHDLGEMLDELIAEYVEHGSFRSDDPSKNVMSFAVTNNPTISICTLKIFLNDEWFSIDYIDLPPEIKVFDSLKLRVEEFGSIEVVRRIHGPAFAAIGACLAGRHYSPDDPLRRVAPTQDGDEG